MLILYGMPLSSPVNKVRFLLNYLALPYQFEIVHLPSGENKQSSYLKINPIGKIPAINDDGFCLAESNAIMRYLANKHDTDLYPEALQARAVVEQWIDFSSHHIGMSVSKVMYNKHFYKMMGLDIDERSLQEGYEFLARFLPVLEGQLSQYQYIASDEMSLADLALLAALDPSEVAGIDLSQYAYLSAWRKKLMDSSFYQACYSSYTDLFTNLVQPSETVD